MSSRLVLFNSSLVMLVVAAAQPVCADDAAECSKARGEEAMAACTHIIAAGNLEGRGLAIIYGNRGKARERKGEHDGAIADYSEAIRLDPNLAAAFNSRGGVYQLKGDFDRAIADHSEAIRLDPRSPVGFQQRGWAYRLKGDFDRAIADLDVAIGLAPADSGAYNSRCVAYRLKGDYDRAVADCSEAIRLNPKFVAAHFNRSLAYSRTRDFDRAIADVDTVIRLAPGDARGYESRCFLRSQKGHFDLAITDCSEAIRLNPKFTAAFIHRGIAYYRNRNLDQAITDFTEVIRLEPNSSEGYRHRGWTYRLKGDFDRAIADMDTSIRLAPNSAIQFSDRGLTYRQKGNFDRAIADYSEAIRLNPKLVVALANRGLLYETKGELNKALADFRAILEIDPQREAAKERVRRIEERLAAIPKRSGKTLENRVALVIGNSSYAKFGKLENPKNDAEKISAALKKSGFTQVTLAYDLTAAKLRDALKAFAAQANRADWAIIYYAGHGIEVGGVNYLVPVDATLASNRDVAPQAVEAQRALVAVEGARKLRLVILDACRDNPFAKTMRRSESGISIGRGLAEIEPEGATLVAFAARHGQQAEDGQGGNSPFAIALVKHIETPGLEISFLFRKVRDDVIKVTSRRQEPYTYGSLPAEEFYFRKR